jgi:hypothetical protein
MTTAKSPARYRAVEGALAAAPQPPTYTTIRDATLPRAKAASFSSLIKSSRS